jgi:hypothetical protein
MAVDIFNIPENVISRDLKGRFICIYGAEKVGKSTFGAKLPRPLFCNFEVGTNYLPVKPVNIDRWSVFKQVLRQLEKPEAHDYYDTVVIDTVSEAYAACEKFVCQQNGVQKIGDIPYGRGYADTKREFEDALRKITMLGFGLCCICHAEKKTIPGPNDTTIDTMQPAMPSRAADVVNRMVDIIAYIDQQFNDKGESVRRFITRRTPKVLAGSRLPYLDPVIPFSYQDLIDAIGRAIDKQQELDGATVVEHSTPTIVKERVIFSDVRGKAQELWLKLVGTGENADPEMANTILKKIEMTMGRKMKLSEFTEDQAELLQLVVDYMEEMLAAR